MGSQIHLIEDIKLQSVFSDKIIVIYLDRRCLQGNIYIRLFALNKHEALFCGFKRKKKSNMEDNSIRSI